NDKYYLLEFPIRLVIKGQRIQVLQEGSLACGQRAPVALSPKRHEGLFFYILPDSVHVLQRYINKLHPQSNREIRVDYHLGLIYPGHSPFAPYGFLVLRQDEFYSQSGIDRKNSSGFDKYPAGAQ